MDVGLAIFMTDLTIDPATLAVEAEARGFSSLWVPEHTHIPTSRRTPNPSGGDLPAEYARILDPLVALSMAAAVTTTLRVGTGVSVIAQHHPITFAKATATLDHLSGGRLQVGVGFGWNAEEMAHHGVDMATRRERVREHVLATQALWANDEAEFHGAYVDFEPSWQWPKPAQRPGPPVLIGGGAGPKMFAHVAEYAQGWTPIGGAGLGESIPRLRQAFVDAGRDPDEAMIVPFGVIPDHGKLDHLTELGVTEIVIRLPAAGPDEVLPLLDRYSEYATARQ